MSICSLCGTAFSCAMADGNDELCWCAQLPRLLPVPGLDKNGACWCPSCLQRSIEAQKNLPPPPS